MCGVGEQQTIEELQRKCKILRQEISEVISEPDQCKHCSSDNKDVVDISTLNHDHQHHDNHYNHN